MPKSKRSKKSKARVKARHRKIEHQKSMWMKKMKDINSKMILKKVGLASDEEE